MTTFTGVIHRDNVEQFLDIVAAPAHLARASARRISRACSEQQAQRPHAGPALEQRRGTGQGTAAGAASSRARPTATPRRHGRRHRGDHPRRRARVGCGRSTRSANLIARPHRATGQPRPKARAVMRSVRSRRARPRLASPDRGASAGPQRRDHREGHALRRDLVRPPVGGARAATRTSPRSGWRAHGSENTAPRRAASSSACAKCAA